MVDAVSVKLPTFWTTSPTAWFAQAEAQFAIRGVTQDDTKYYHVVAALDTSTATRTVLLLSSPPTTDKYSAIKTFLISAYDLSDSERASALFNLPGLGDSKPSELMDSMLSLLGTHTPCFLFRHLFLQQLPDYVRAPLAPSSTDNYRALAQEADKIYLAGRQNLQEVNIPQHTPRAKFSKPPTDRQCYFHRRWGRQTTKCEPHCKHYSRNQGNEFQGQR